ncbi:hypothetical protein BGX33_006518 [Mortierella sp. NVP41]|nr:hypothetical protein BGX33_006518 [Mortierella sp. NVP41]
MAQGASLYRLLNLVVAILIILGGILLFVHIRSWNSSILGVFVVMGQLTLSWKWFNILVGCFIMAVGVFYIAMHFVGATPSPSMSAVPNTSTTNLNPGNSGSNYTNLTHHDDLQPNMTETYQNQGTH